MLEPLSLSVVPFISSNVAVRAISWRHTLLRLTIYDRRRISKLPRVHLALLQRTAEDECSFKKNTQIHRASGKATHVSCKISGQLRRRQTIRRSVQLLGDAHALPIDDRGRTPGVLALTILSNSN